MIGNRFALTIAGTAAACLLAAGIWLLWKYNPNEHYFFPACQFHRLTGLHCPGCGGTRAAHALLHGDLIRAIRCNALLVVGIPLFIIALLRQRHLEQRGRAAYKYLAIVVIICLLAFSILRNIPSPTRSPWAPPDTSLTRWMRHLDYGDCTIAGVAELADAHG